MPARILSRDEDRETSASLRLSGGSSFAVASATSRLPRSSARRKTVRACPCEVGAVGALLSGAERLSSGAGSRQGFGRVLVSPGQALELCGVVGARNEGEGASNAQAL
jgi:hypothetical protein